MKPFNSDSLAFVDPHLVGEGVFRCVSTLQHCTPEQQVAATAVLLLLQCRKLGAHVGTVLNVANNIIDRTIHETPQLGAAKDYVRLEL